MTRARKNAIDHVGEPPGAAPVAAAATPEPPTESADETLERMKRESRNVILRKLLGRPFEPQQIKFKPQMVKNNRCLAMPYIDARLIQDRLDDVLGVENWEDTYELLPDGCVMCRLAIRYGGGEWVTKSDVGSPSEQPESGDRMKAAFSDALKRAAVKFGIGRYLYRLPAQWVDYDPVKKKITQAPNLPEWAKPPAVDKTAPVYELGEEEPEAVPAIVAASPAPTAAVTPNTEKPAEKPKVPVDENKVTAERISWWSHELTGCQTPADMTKLVHEHLKDEPGFAKDAVWKFIQKNAIDVGWRWNPNTKAFYPTKESVNQASPF